MSTEKASGLKVVRVESARVRVNNESNAQRTVDVEAVMEVRSQDVSSISAGVVQKDGVQVASFDSYSTDSLSVNFMRSTGSMETMEAINAFCADIRANGPALVSL